MRPAFCGVPDRQKTLRPGSLSPAVPLAGVGTHHRPAERLKPDPKACFCPIIDNQRLLLKPTTATQTWRREPLFMPLSSPPHRRISTTSADATALTR